MLSLILFSWPNNLFNSFAYVIIFQITALVSWNTNKQLCVLTKNCNSWKRKYNIYMFTLEPCVPGMCRQVCQNLVESKVFAKSSEQPNWHTPSSGDQLGQPKYESVGALEVGYFTIRRAKTMCALTNFGSANPKTQTTIRTHRRRRRLTGRTRRCSYGAGKLRWNRSTARGYCKYCLVRPISGGFQNWKENERHYPVVIAVGPVRALNRPRKNTIRDERKNRTMAVCGRFDKQPFKKPNVNFGR